ncbi:hypothetical protein FACS189443_0910 [Planctomycetales bacterium]|nr:hypothetical protein FACS189443_0910 [Planctomycetales bacterium]
MRSITITLTLPLVSLLLLVAGCGEYSPYKVVFVTGTVLVDGKPMDGINVAFSPVNESEGHSAGGVTDAEGKFTLTTGGLKVGKGAVPGKYNVLFNKSSNEADGITSEAEYMRLFSGSPPKVIILLPTKYNSAKTSGIPPVTVEKSGKNEFRFELSLEGLPPPLPPRRPAKERKANPALPSVPSGN